MMEVLQCGISPILKKSMLSKGIFLGIKLFSIWDSLFSQWTSSSMKLYQLQGKRFVYLIQDADGIAEFERTMNMIAEQLKAQTEIDGKIIKIEAVCAISTTEEHQDPKRLYTEALAC